MKYRELVDEIEMLLSEGSGATPRAMAEMIASHFRGDRIYFGRADDHRRARDRRIRASNASAETEAARHGLSARQIQRIRKKGHS